MSVWVGSCRIEFERWKFTLSTQLESARKASERDSRTELVEMCRQKVATARKARKVRQVLIVQAETDERRTGAARARRKDKSRKWRGTRVGTRCARNQKEKRKKEKMNRIGVHFTSCRILAVCGLRAEKRVLGFVVQVAATFKLQIGPTILATSVTHHHSHHHSSTQWSQPAIIHLLLATVSIHPSHSIRIDLRQSILSLHVRPAKSAVLFYTSGLRTQVTLAFNLPASISVRACQAKNLLFSIWLRRAAQLRCKVNTWVIVSGAAWSSVCALDQKALVRTAARCDAEVGKVAKNANSDDDSKRPFERTETPPILKGKRTHTHSKYGDWDWNMDWLWLRSVQKRKNKSRIEIVGQKCGRLFFTCSSLLFEWRFSARQKKETRARKGPWFTKLENKNNSRCKKSA